MLHFVRNDIHMSNLNEAIKILSQGGIVIYPTDTACGIGCRIDDEKAVKRLFQIRKRPVIQATPVLIDSIEMAEKYFLSPIADNVRRLIKVYWPGALTIVYKCRTELIPSLVCGGSLTIGLRMPNHDVPLALIEAVGVPILGPSANFHGQETPFSYSQLDPQLLKLVDFVIDGKCSVGNVSTVIDCVGSPIKIIRQGAVKLEMSFRA